MAARCFAQLAVAAVACSSLSLAVSGDVDFGESWNVWMNAHRPAFSSVEEERRASATFAANMRYIQQANAKAGLTYKLGGEGPFADLTLDEFVARHTTAGDGGRGGASIPRGDERALMDAVASRLPVAAAVYAETLEVMLYRSGVLDVPSCGSRRGYLRLKRGKNMCGIADFAVLPIG